MVDGSWRRINVIGINSVEVLYAPLFIFALKGVRLEDNLLIYFERGNDNGTECLV